MKSSRFVGNCTRLIIAAVSLAGLAASAALGQGTVVIRDPVRPPWRPNRVTTTPLILKYQRVFSDVTDGVAVTRIEQTFTNPMPTQIEGTYVFPLPENAGVGDFSMTVNGKTLSGEVLDADAARRTYEDIVRRTRDPGLLEYLNGRLYRASIFPIPPGGQLDVKLQYSQALEESSGLGLFKHPLGAESADLPPIEQLTIQVKMKSTLPLTSVFCPSHKCDIVRLDDYHATATYEQAFVRPDRDFMLYYQRRDAQFGLSLLTHRQAGEPGYFLLRISPRIEMAGDQVLAKDIAFVVDTSGSMQGDKMEQARRALKFCINALSPRDRFNVYAFSTDVRPFRDNLVAADGDVKSAALDFADKLQAVGGTNINQALLAALAGNPRDPARPFLVVFMTDGEPTVDVTDPEQIVRNVEAKNPSGEGRVRLHVLGVGTQVNTRLLDKLAESSRGARDYCTEKEDLELKMSGFVGRLANPVLAGLSFNIAGLSVSDVCPRELPDLFHGGELLILGRYDGTGHHAVEIKGTAKGEGKSLVYEGEFPKLNAANDFLPRLWANRRVAYLLDQIRLHGQNREVIDEVIRLAKRHGIVTPYTSSLILEDEGRIARNDVPRPAAPREEALHRLARKSAASDAGDGSVGGARGGGRGRVLRAGESATGETAVEASKEIRELKTLGYISDRPASQPGGGRGARPGDAESDVVRHVGEKTFVFDGQRWVDAAWDGKKEPKKLAAFTDAYFELVKKHPKAARWFALGERVLVVIDGEPLETTAPAP